MDVVQHGEEAYATGEGAILVELGPSAEAAAETRAGARVGENRGPWAPRRRRNTSGSSRLGPAKCAWKAWGPYLSERQWGTVREDYSADGDAWDYFPHDHARSRAYRWGEDGLAGICDDQQRLCFALALWNGSDPILKERLFGLTEQRGQPRRGRQGVLLLPRRHADALVPASASTSTRRRAFPYDDLVDENRAPRAATSPSTSCSTPASSTTTATSTSSSSTPRPAPDDILIRITVAQPRPGRGAAAPAADAVVPQHVVVDAAARAEARRCAAVDGGAPAVARDTTSSATWHAASADAPSCCSARTRRTRPALGQRGRRAVPKDASTTTSCTARRRGQPRAPAPRPPRRCDDRAAGGESATIRAAASTARRTPTTRSATLRRGLRDAARGGRRVLRRGHRRPALDADARAACMRQALAGMLWSKQYYDYDVHALAARARRRPAGDAERAGRPQRPVVPHGRPTTSSRCRTSGSTRGSRRGTSRSTASPLSLVDVDFAKEQLELLLRTRYLHPNGQIPAYEWNFGDVNPPVHAWAALCVYQREAEHPRRGRPRVPRARLPAAADRTSPGGSTARTPTAATSSRAASSASTTSASSIARAPLPGGGTLEQADGTALDGAVLPVDAADRARARRARSGLRGHGDEVRRALRVDRGRAQPAGRHTPPVGRAGRLLLRRACGCRTGRRSRCSVRSLVGLLPMCAATVFEPEVARRASRA